MEYPDDREYLKELLDINIKRLQALKKQKAIQGINTPPEILIEIKKIETEIEKIKKDLSKLDPYPDGGKIRQRLKQSFWKWAGIIIILIAMIFLGVYYRNEIWHQLNLPHPKIASLSYTINDGPAKVATRGEIIELHVDEKLCLIDLRSSSPRASNLRHTVQGQAYIRKGVRPELDIDYDDGRFTAAPPIQAGIQNIGDFTIGPNLERNPCWMVKSEWNTVIIYLYHHYYSRSKIDDTFFLTLAVTS